MRFPSGWTVSAAVALASLTASSQAQAADGDLDATFWSDGRVALPGAGEVTFGGLAANGSGEMAVGYSTHAAEKLGYWRAVTGSTWGAPCRVIVESVSAEIDTWVFDLAFDASGRLIVLARKDLFDGGDGVFAVLAYDFPNCVLDSEFGSDGIVYLPGSALFVSASRLAATSNGKILIAGGELIFESPGDDHRYSRIVRLDANGDFDLSFSDDGVVLGPDRSWGADLAVAANGHIVVAATSVSTDERDFHLQDFDANGTFLAETFVAFDLGGTDVDDPSAIAATPDGRVVVVGTAGANPIQAFTYGAIAVLGWDPQGDLVLDSTFSSDGRMAVGFSNRIYNSLSDVVVQGTNRFLVAGTAKTQILDNAMAVARLSIDGSLDGTFHPPGNGRRLVDFDIAAPENDLANRLALQGGRIVLGGQVDIAGDSTSVGLARLENQWIFAGGFDGQEVSDWLFSPP